MSFCVDRAVYGYMYSFPTIEYNLLIILIQVLEYSTINRIEYLIFFIDTLLLYLFFAAAPPSDSTVAVCKTW